VCNRLQRSAGKENSINYTASLITNRQNALDLFGSLRSKAVRSALVKRVTGRCCNALSAFSEILPNLSPDRCYAGVQNIRLEQITGSVGRAADFDRDFRPLKAHMRERWVMNYLYMQSGGHEAILVYKVGDQYYVEDGHHRVSVAHASGMAYIEAEVWEYHTQLAPQMPAALAPRPIDPWLTLQPASSCSCVEMG
jgi:hypothetical protein